MISTHSTKDSVPIALDLNSSDPDVIYYHRKPINPDPDSGSDSDSGDESDSDISDSDLTLHYGVRATRYKTQRTKLKKQYKQEIQEGKILHGKYTSKKGTIVPFPDRDDRDPRTAYHVMGKAGSGKTTWVLEQTKIIQKLFNKKVFVINGKEDEKRFDQAKYTTLDVDDLLISDTSDRKYTEAKLRYKMLDKSDLDPEEVISMKLAVESLKPKKKINYQVTEKFKKLIPNSIWIFDDIEGGELQHKALFLLDWILTKARSTQSDIFVITHLPSWGQNTRTLHNEINIYVIFQRNKPRANKFLMEKYLQFKAKEIKKVNNLLNRNDWVAINQHRNCLIAPHKVCLI